MTTLLLQEYYLYIKAFHVISIVCWMAGLLYLPRLFVYHVEAKHGSSIDQKFQIMEKRLMRFIMNPAMISSFLFGAMLFFAHDAEHFTGWFHAKLTLIFIMTISHIMMISYIAKFAIGQNNKSSKYFRVFNELPTVCMVCIIILAIVKPF